MQMQFWHTRSYSTVDDPAQLLKIPPVIKYALVLLLLLLVTPTLTAVPTRRETDT